MVGSTLVNGVCEGAKLKNGASAGSREGAKLDDLVCKEGWVLLLEGIGVGFSEGLPVIFFEKTAKGTRDSFEDGITDGSFALDLMGSLDGVTLIAPDGAKDGDSLSRVLGETAAEFIEYTSIAEIFGLNLTGRSSSVNDPSITVAFAVSVMAVNAPPALTTMSKPA